MISTHMNKVTAAREQKELVLDEYRRASERWVVGRCSVSCGAQEGLPERGDVNALGRLGETVM